MEYKHELFSKLQTFVMKLDRIDPPSTVVAAATSSKSMLDIQGQYFIHMFQKQVSLEFYKLHFITPLVFIFRKNGVACSRELCMDAISYAVSVTEV